MFDASSSEILDLSLLSTEMWLTEVFPFHNWNRQCWFFVLKNRQVLMLGQDVHNKPATNDHINQHECFSFFFFYYVDQDGVHVDFIPISSSRSSTSSSRCRMLHWRRKSRLWPQRQSGEKLNAQSFEALGPKKILGLLQGNSFSKILVNKMKW